MANSSDATTCCGCRAALALGRHRHDGQRSRRLFHQAVRLRLFYASVQYERRTRGLASLALDRRWTAGWRSDRRRFRQRGRPLPAGEPDRSGEALDRQGGGPGMWGAGGEGAAGGLGFVRRPWRIALGVMLLWAASGTAGASAAPSATIVIDAATAAVLKSNQASALWRPASLTKLMTLYITFQELAAGHLQLGEKLTVSGYAAAMPPSALGLSKGEKITVEQAILATITRSANDAVVVLAERIGGDETTFAQRMTATARNLGMTGSVFRNASGLPDPEQTTTARD